MLKNYVQTGTVTKGEKGAVSAPQVYLIFCGIAAKCFINPPHRRLCRKVHRRLQTITDKGMKKICPFLSVSVRICPYAKHNGCFFLLILSKSVFFQGDERRF